jgi:hypothetical protein
MLQRSILIRNERRKLAANYLNSIASATFVGGWLPLFVTWSVGAGKLSEGSLFPMVFAIMFSDIITTFAARILNGLEEVE